MDWLKTLWNNIANWIKAMTCEKKAIEEFKRLALPSEPITSEEKVKIRSLCSAGLGLPWYVVADVVFQERGMKKATGRISGEFGNLTDQEVKWIYDCLKSSQWGVDELIQFIRKARSNNTPLPTL